MAGCRRRRRRRRWRHGSSSGGPRDGIADDGGAQCLGAVSPAPLMRRHEAQRSIGSGKGKQRERLVVLSSSSFDAARAPPAARSLRSPLFSRERRRRGFLRRLDGCRQSRPQAARRGHGHASIDSLGLVPLLRRRASARRALATTAAVPTFVVSCRECSRAVAGALRAAGVERFEVFPTGGGVAEERALAAALAAVVSGVRISERREAGTPRRARGCTTTSERGSSSASATADAGPPRGPCPRGSPREGGSWTPPSEEGAGRRRQRRSSGGGGSYGPDGDGDDGPARRPNCGLSALGAVGAALASAWAFLVDAPPTEEERARRRQQRHERSAAEAARRGEGSTTAVFVGGGSGGRSGSGSGSRGRPVSPSPPGASADCSAKRRLDSGCRTCPLKHDVDGAPVSLQTAVDAFAVERAEEEWVEARREMAAKAAAEAAARRLPHASSDAAAEPAGPTLMAFEPALHEFAPPELSREARATAVRNALRGASGGGGGEGSGCCGGGDTAAALAVAAAVAEEGARLSAAALLKALCRAVGGQLAASVVVAALRLEGQVSEADGDSDCEEEEEEMKKEEEEEEEEKKDRSAAAVESFERDLEGSGRGGRGGKAARCGSSRAAARRTLLREARRNAAASAADAAPPPPPPAPARLQRRRRKVASPPASARSGARSRCCAEGGARSTARGGATI